MFTNAQTARTALAGGGSADWRIICDCQRHRPRRAWKLPRLGAAPRVPALLLGVSLSVGAVAFPVPGNLRPAPVNDQTIVDLKLVSLENSLLPPPVDASRIEDRLLREKVREDFFRTEVPWGTQIYNEARRNNLPPELVAAVIRTESDFRPRLVSHKNAVGLMQLLPSTGSFMGAGNIEDPAENIRVGTRYLRYLNRMFNGNQTLVLAAYNAGPGAVKRYGGVPPYRETQGYVRKVQKSRSEFAARIARRVAAERQRQALRLPGDEARVTFASFTAGATTAR